MEWIASSHVLLRKEKTGRPSQQQSIDRLVISPFYDEALGFKSQPAHHLPSIVSLSSCSLSIALGKVRGQLALGAVCEWSTAHKCSGKGLVRMQRHSATVESAQGDDGGASIISWVPWCPGGSMRRSPSRLSPGRRVGEHARAMGSECAHGPIIPSQQTPWMRRLHDLFWNPANPFSFTTPPTLRVRVSKIERAGIPPKTQSRGPETGSDGSALPRPRVHPPFPDQ